MNWFHYFTELRNIGFRYFFASGVVFLIFYVLFRNRYAGKRIQAKFPKTGDYYREIGYSMLTMTIFALVPTFLIFTPAIRAHTLILDSPFQYGAFYFWFAFVLMFFIHDAYFYWAHRLMHHPRLFKYFHAVHHQSVNPSPFAAYAFHPLEAFVEVGIFVFFIFCLPVHFIHLGFFFLFQIGYNVYGHSGYEFYPKGFNKGRFGKWVNTSVAHNMHHQYFKGNYGLYTMIWDRWMGTTHPNYDVEFEKNKTQTITTALPQSNTVSHAN